MSCRFLVVGEALVDIVPTPGGGERELPGGSPANVALTLGRLGRDVRLATTLGDDARGRSVRTWLESARVEVAAAPPGSGRTSTARVTLAPDGSASYDFDLTWDPPAVGTAGADVVHVGSVATVMEPGAAVVRDAVREVRHRAVVSFDPNARPGLTPDVAAATARVEELVALSDIVKVSEEDLDWYHPGTAARDVAACWADSGPALVVVTLGPGGALAVRHDGRRLRASGREVEVSDTVGAGDTFSGVLLDALATAGAHGPDGASRLRRLPDAAVESALRAATAGASVTVARAGADPPTRAELHGVLGQPRP